MDDPVKFLNSLFDVAVKAALPQEFVFLLICLSRQRVVRL